MQLKYADFKIIILKPILMHIRFGFTYSNRDIFEVLLKFQIELIIRRLQKSMFEKIVRSMNILKTEYIPMKRKPVHAAISLFLSMFKDHKKLGFIFKTYIKNCDLTKEKCYQEKLLEHFHRRHTVKLIESHLDSNTCSLYKSI
jgi:hypothetical protein